MPIVVGHDDTNGYAAALGNAAYQSGVGQADEHAQAVEQQQARHDEVARHAQMLAPRMAQAYGPSPELQRRQGIAMQNMQQSQADGDFQFTPKQRARLGELNNQEQQLHQALSQGLIHDDEAQEHQSRIDRERQGMTPLPVIKPPAPPPLDQYMQQGNYAVTPDGKFGIFRTPDGKHEIRPIKDDSWQAQHAAQQEANAAHRTELETAKWKADQEIKQAAAGQKAIETDARVKGEQAKLQLEHEKAFHERYLAHAKRLSSDSVNDEGNKVHTEASPAAVLKAMQDEDSARQQYELTHAPAPGVNPQAPPEVHQSAKRIMELHEQHAAGKNLSTADWDELRGHVAKVQPHLVA